MRALALLIALGFSTVAAAQVVDPGASLRLQNQQRWNEGQLRNLEADIGGLRTDQTLRGIQRGRQPDPVLSARERQLEAVEAESLSRASQAASTARAAGLRASSPLYDQRLRELGFATGLPTPRR